MEDKSKEIIKKEADTPEGVERTRDEKVFLPAVDIIERKDDIIIISDVPGCDENTVDITLEKNILTINAKVNKDNITDKRLVLNEYEVGDYQRVFTLSNEVDRDKIQAKVKNGLLKVILPKAAQAKSRKIAVTTE
ncbi:MAG: Hsp20/alpha crystallin family protein [Thermodesulfovibrionales bacterium]|nr:Hsp20/alpha crystallin family protein [Thermodesulfovibrionales bacterium]